MTRLECTIKLNEPDRNGVIFTKIEDDETIEKIKKGLLFLIDYENYNIDIRSIIGIIKDIIYEGNKIFIDVEYLPNVKNGFENVKLFAFPILFGNVNNDKVYFDTKLIGFKFSECHQKEIK
jgi:hypothetical protein